MRRCFCSSVRRVTSVGMRREDQLDVQRRDRRVQTRRRAMPARAQPPERLVARADLRRRVRIALVDAAAPDPVMLLGDVGEREEVRERARDRQRLVDRHRSSTPVSASKSASLPAAGALRQRAHALDGLVERVASPAAAAFRPAARRAGGRHLAGASGDLRHVRSLPEDGEDGCGSGSAFRVPRWVPGSGFQVGPGSAPVPVPGTVRTAERGTRNLRQNLEPGTRHPEPRPRTVIGSPSAPDHRARPRPHL